MGLNIVFALENLKRYGWCFTILRAVCLEIPSIFLRPRNDGTKLKCVKYGNTQFILD